MSSNLDHAGVIPRTRDDERLLRGALAEASDTRVLELGAGVLEKVADVLRESTGRKPAAVVADTNTHQAAGARVVEVLRAAGAPMVDPLVLDAEGLAADYAQVELLRAAIARHDAVPVAVGSGTINDLVKLASHLCQRSYVCVATAASMDGYTAFGASITRDGSKQTFFCPAPRAVIADTDVLRRAPAAMNAAGYADLLCKVTAGADWLVADGLGVEPIHARAWDLVQTRLRDWLADAEGVGRGEPAAIRKLILGLLMTGFAMQTARSSRPASGAEHQFSHLWDMQHHTHDGRVPLHGHKVAVGTVMVALLYERLLDHPLDRLPIEDLCRRWPTLPQRLGEVERAHETEHLKRTALEETRVKHLDGPALAERLRRLQDCWPSLRRRLIEQLMPPEELCQRLAQAGAPSAASAIGITPARLRRSFFLAQQIRRRYTVLDLALETGLLAPSVEAIFASGRLDGLARPGSLAAESDAPTSGRAAS